MGKIFGGRKYLVSGGEKGRMKRRKVFEEGNIRPAEEKRRR